MWSTAAKKRPEIKNHDEKVQGAFSIWRIRDLTAFDWFFFRAESPFYRDDVMKVDYVNVRGPS